MRFDISSEITTATPTELLPVAAMLLVLLTAVGLYVRIDRGATRPERSGSMVILARVGFVAILAWAALTFAYGSFAVYQLAKQKAQSVTEPHTPANDERSATDQLSSEFLWHETRDEDVG